MSGRIKHQDIFVALAQTGLTQHFEYRSVVEYDSSRRLEQFVEIIAAKAAAAEREACEKVASDYADYQRSFGDEYAELRAMGALEAMEGAGMNLGKSPSTLWQMMKLDDEWKARLEAAVAAEREACADVCDRIANLWPRSSLKEGWRKGYVDGGSACRNLIRERGQE